MSIKKHIRNYFGFSKTETNALIILLPTCLTILVVYGFMRERLFFDAEFDKEDLELLAKIEKDITEILEQEEQDSIRATDSLKADSIPPFNPNIVSKAFLDSVGIPQHIASNWSNYINKGGKFYNDSSLLRIYGMTSEVFTSLSGKLIFPKKNYNPPTSTQKKITKSNINEADTVELKSIRGIGKVFATRIIKFRDKLGGFTNMEQLYEVYNLDSNTVNSLYERFYLEKNFKPQQININNATVERLSGHPYISYKLANLILAYRTQREFGSVSELLSLPLVDSVLLKKISPYLTIESSAAP